MKGHFTNRPGWWKDLALDHLCYGRYHTLVALLYLCFSNTQSSAEAIKLEHLFIFVEDRKNEPIWINRMVWESNEWFAGKPRISSCSLTWKSMCGALNIEFTDGDIICRAGWNMRCTNPPPFHHDQIIPRGCGMLINTTLVQMNRGDEINH